MIQTPPPQLGKCFQVPRTPFPSPLRANRPPGWMEHLKTKGFPWSAHHWHLHPSKYARDALPIFPAFPWTRDPFPVVYIVISQCCPTVWVKGHYWFAVNQWKVPPNRNITPPWGLLSECNYNPHDRISLRQREVGQIMDNIPDCISRRFLLHLWCA